MNEPEVAWTIAFRYSMPATALEALAVLERAEEERPLNLEFTVDGIGPSARSRDDNLPAEKVVVYLVRLLADAALRPVGVTISERRPEAVTWEYGGSGGGGTASALFDGLMDGIGYYGV
jgi:hypothetical protein